MTENQIKDILGKLELATAIVQRALSCPMCRDSAKELIQSYKDGNHLGGGLLTEQELTEVNLNEINRVKQK